MSDKAEKFWDQAAGAYDFQVNKKFAQSYKDTAELSRKYLQPEKSLLEIGCGTGIMTVTTAPLVESVCAIDISPAMLSAAEKKAQSMGIGNITFAVSDIFDSGLDGRQFDIVSAFNVLFLLENEDKVIRRIRSLLSPSGIFISVTDCHGHAWFLQRFLMYILSRSGLIPYMRQYTTGSLEQSIEKHGFRILETASLYPKPPNYFIAAQKEA